MINYEAYCSIQEYRGLGLSQRKTAEELGISRVTVNRYWNMTMAEYEDSRSIRDKLHLKRKEILTMAATQSPESIADTLSKKYKMDVSARSIRRLISEWQSEHPQERSEASLYCGDCMDVLRHIEPNSIDLVVTDPPYKIVSGGCRIVEGADEVSGIFRKRSTVNGFSDDEQFVAVKEGKLFANNDIAFSVWIPEVFRVLKENTHFYCMTN